MENINKILKKARGDKKVIAVALFGSSLKRKGRDIDICIFLDKKYSNLEMSRERLEYSKITDDCDIHIFQQLPVYIRVRVIKEGKILLDKKTDLLYEIAYSTIKEFGFFKKIYENYLNEVKNG